MKLPEYLLRTLGWTIACGLVGALVGALAWYDNEWGYVNRMAELARKVARSLPEI